MSSFTPAVVYLVTGANRGIGFALVEHIAVAHPDAFIYAGARNLENATALQSLMEKYPARISIVKCVSGDEEGNTAIAEEIKKRHGRVDTVIANAAYANFEKTALETTVKEYTEHLLVNVIGTIVLLQSMHKLLKKSQTPRFIPISSPAGSIGSPMMEFPIKNAAYGTSKAALNHITRKFHFENDWLTTFALCPGAVSTDAMEIALQRDETLANLIKHVEVLTPEQSAQALLKIINESTRIKDGGQFIDIDGKRIAW